MPSEATMRVYFDRQMRSDYQTMIQDSLAWSRPECSLRGRVDDAARNDRWSSGDAIEVTDDSYTKKVRENNDRFDVKRRSERVVEYLNEGVP